MTVDGNREESDSALKQLFYHSDRIRFIYWHRFSGAKFTVMLIAAIAILSFITGLSTLSREEIDLIWPVAEYIPQMEPAVRFGGVILAFILAMLTLGLLRRKRIAWYLTTVVIPLVILIPMAGLESTHIPLLGLSLIAIPLLLMNRRHFEARLDLSALQIASLASIVAVLAYGTIGSFVLQDQFSDLETWTDAFYYVLVSIATVGYGDITPRTTEAQWFALSVIIFGTGAFTVAIGSLIVPAIEKRMASAVGNIKPSGLNLMEDHVIVLGHSDITRSLIAQLEGHVDVVVITPDIDEATFLEEEDITVLRADPTREESLEEAGIEYARGVVVATRDDAQDVLAVLAVRNVDPDIRIVGAANQPHNVQRLQDVGADEVISPFDIGGLILSKSVLENRSAESLLERLKSNDDGETEE